MGIQLTALATYERREIVLASGRTINAPTMIRLPEELCFSCSYTHWQQLQVILGIFTDDNGIVSGEIHVLQLQKAVLSGFAAVGRACVTGVGPDRVTAIINADREYFANRLVEIQRFTEEATDRGADVISWG